MLQESRFVLLLANYYFALYSSNFDLASTLPVWPAARPLLPRGRATGAYAPPVAAWSLKGAAASLTVTAAVPVIRFIVTKKASRPVS